MSAVFGETFDHYAFADITQKWTQVMPSGGDASGIFAVGRQGTNGLRIAKNATGLSDVSKQFRTFLGPQGDIHIAQMAFRSVTSFSIPHQVIDPFGGPCIHKVMQGGLVQVWFKSDPAGTITAYRGTSNFLGTTSAAMGQAVYHYLKFKVGVHDTTGFVEVWFGDVRVLNLTGIDTKETGAGAGWDEFGIGPLRGGNLPYMEWNYDDILIMNGAGTAYNTTIPDHAGRYCPAVIEGFHRDSIPLIGTDGAAMVDDVQADGDASYTTLGAPGQRDSFAVSNWPSTGAVGPVQVIAQVRGAEAGTASLKLGVRTGSPPEDVDGVIQSHTSNYAFYRQIFEKDPVTTAPWQPAVGPEVMILKEV